MTRPLRKTEMAGTGCLIQGVALLLAIGGFLLGPAVGVVTLIGGIALFLVGSARSRVWICPSCRNPLAGVDVRVCPACRAEFGATPSLRGAMSEEEKRDW